MSDGGCGESSKEVEPSLKKRRKIAKNDEFAQAIARIAVAQVCESVGFQGFQQSALDTFSDVACKYVSEIGKVSCFYANLAGRSECNVFDIIQGLEDLNLSQGFVGASDRDNCLSGSGIVKDLSQFVNLSEEIAFAYSIPSFPVVKERKSTPSFLQAGEAPPTEDIPPWLPVFHDPITPPTQTVPDKIEQEQKGQKVLDPPLLKLESNGSELGNPFLAVPIPPGEKDISVVSLPAKLKEDDLVHNHSNHVSDLDQSDPTNEAVKKSDTEEGSGMVVLKNRPPLQMKFEMGKKSLSGGIRPDEKRKEKVATWFVNDEARDEKGKIIEKVAKVGMDIEEGTGNESAVN